MSLGGSDCSPVVVGGHSVRTNNVRPVRGMQSTLKPKRRVPFHALQAFSAFRGSQDELLQSLHLNEMIISLLYRIRKESQSYGTSIELPSRHLNDAA